MLGLADIKPQSAVEKAFAVLGRRWNGVILARLAAGPRRFADLRRAVSGISDSVLADRLDGLARADLVLRSVEAGPPIAVTYRMSPAGEALKPALAELTRWAEHNLAGTGPR